MTTDVQSLQTRATGLTAEVQAVVVADQPTFAAAGAVLRDIATYIKSVNEVMDPIVKAAHEAHRVAVGQRDGLLKPAEAAKRSIGQKMADYEQAQARLRREAELAQQRERERLEREAREAAEIERRRLQKEADDVAAGDTAGAERLIEAPVVVPVVIAAPVVLAMPPPPPLPRAEGTSFRTDDDFEITDESIIPRMYLMPNAVAIRKVYKALKAKTDIPGTRHIERRIPITRTG